MKSLSPYLIKFSGLKEGTHLFNYEVGNISAGSWGPGNWLAHATERGIYEAEVIILVTNSTDWNDNPHELPMDYLNMPMKKPKFASEELIKRYIIPIIKINSQSKYRTKPINYENKKGLKDLNKFISLVRKKGAEIVVVQFWDKDEFESYKPKIGHEIIRKVFKDNKVKYIDSVDRFRKCSENSSDLYIDYIHPFTKKGQQCLGHVLFDALQTTEFFNKNIFL